MNKRLESFIIDSKALDELKKSEMMELFDGVNRKFVTLEDRI